MIKIKTIIIMKEEFFILQQPKHSIISVVLVNSEFPLTEKQHNVISELNEFTDVFFIFQNSRLINKNKFTSLYEGCGWTDSGENLFETYLKTILYSLEIFETHVGFCFYNMSDLNEYNVSESKEKIISLTASSVVNPVFKIRRLNADEFYDIYKNSNSGLFNRDETTNMYCSYTSESNVVFFKRSTLGLLIDFWRSCENNKYIKSFSQKDPRYFLASVCKFLNISTINSDICDLDIGKLTT